MVAEGHRLAVVFIWKQGDAPDLDYARQILAAINPGAYIASLGENTRLHRLAVTRPWPQDPWQMAIAQMEAIGTGDNSLWTDTRYYELAGWQGRDRRTGERLFVVTVYRRAAGLSHSTGQANTTPSLARIPFQLQRPTGDLEQLSTGGEGADTHPTSHVESSAYPFGINPMLSGPLTETGSLEMAPGPISLTPPIQQIEAQMQSPVSDSYEHFYVGFGPRLAGAVVDFVVVALLLVQFAFLPFFAPHAGPQTPGFWAWLQSYGGYTCLLLTGAALVFSLYHVIQWTIWGQTVGQRMVHIRVVDAKGNKPDAGRSITRVVGYLLTLPTGPWAVAMIAMNPQRQGLHDALSGTYVVPEKPDGVAPAGLPGYGATAVNISGSQTNRDSRPGTPTQAAEQLDAAAMLGSTPAYSFIKIKQGANEPGTHEPNAEIRVENTPVSGSGEEAATERMPMVDVPGDNWNRTSSNQRQEAESLTDEMSPEHFSAYSTLPQLPDLTSGPLHEVIVSTANTGPISGEKEIREARALYKLGMAQMETGVNQGPRLYKVEPGAARSAAAMFRQALQLVPTSVVYRYSYSVALRYSEGLAVALSELRLVLKQDPDHFEARQQIAYGQRWHDAFAYPSLISPTPVEQGVPLPEAIKATLPDGQAAATRLVLLREGGTKTAAFISRTPISLWAELPSASMPACVRLYLSRTPFGPIIALYVLLYDNPADPYIGETFLNPHDPGHPTDDACLLGQNMLTQLAKQDRTFLIFSDERERLLLSRKLIFDATTQVNMARVLFDVQSLPPLVIEAEAFQQAAQWHMQNFELDQLKEA
ncbi:MAG: RDD family protein [Chloroflexota bacterium]|nr:RDD family protein [Chloroflexota bacterium]